MLRRTKASLMAKATYRLASCWRVTSEDVGRGMRLEVEGAEGRKFEAGKTVSER